MPASEKLHTAIVPKGAWSVESEVRRALFETVRNSNEF